MQKDLNNHSISDLTLLKRKENANDCTTSTLQEPNKNTEIFFAVNKLGSEKGNNLKATKTLTTSFDPNTGWRFYRQSRENLQTSSSGSRAYLQEASSSSSTWDQTQWKTSNLNSQYSSSPDKVVTLFS